MISKEKRTAIHIRKTRTSSEVIKECFQYLSTEARTLAPALTAYSISVLTFSIVISIFVTESLPSIERLFLVNQDLLPKNHFLFMVISALAYLGSVFTLCLVVNRTFLLADGKKNDSDEESIFLKLKKNFPNDLKNQAINFIVLYVFYFLVTFGLDYLSDSDVIFDRNDREYDLGGYYLEIFIMNIPKIVLYPAVLYFLISAFFICMRDNLSSTEALKKAYDITKSKMRKMWIDCGLVLLIGIIGIYIVSVPLGALYYFISSGHNAFTITSGLAMIINSLVLVFLSTGAILTFGSIEDENEGYYIKSKIADLHEDSPEDPQEPEAHSPVQ